MATKAGSKVLTDHDEIRKWAEERGARPSAVKRTGKGNDPGILRLDFPGYSGEDSLEEIPWEEFLEKFDDNNLALLVQERTAGGQRSNFNKLISRETAEQNKRGRSRGTASSRSRRTSSSGSSGSRSRTSARSSGSGRKSSRAVGASGRKSSKSASSSRAGAGPSKRTSRSRRAA